MNTHQVIFLLLDLCMIVVLARLLSPPTVAEPDGGTETGPQRAAHVGSEQW